MRLTRGEVTAMAPAARPRYFTTSLFRPTFDCVLPAASVAQTKKRWVFLANLQRKRQESGGAGEIGRCHRFDRRGEDRRGTEEGAGGLG